MFDDDRPETQTVRDTTVLTTWTDKSIADRLQDGIIVESMCAKITEPAQVVDYISVTGGDRRYVDSLHW